MKHLFNFLLIIFSVAAINAQSNKTGKVKAVFLEKISWVEAEKILKPESVVVIALGAQAKEHGPHLPLATDFIQAEYFKNRIAERSEVLIAPSINYGFYPGFVDYPGSTTLRFSVSREMIIDICRSFAHFGVKRFYIINIGISTKPALEQSAKSLADEGILLRFTDPDKIASSVIKEVSKEEKGTHAEEIETSIMLYISPQSVDMRKAVKDYGIVKGGRGFPLTRNADAQQGLYSPSGIFGDATLATREKGLKVVEAMVEYIAKEIEDLRRAMPIKAERVEENYDNYTGQYQLAPNDTITISKDSGFLTMERSGKSKSSLTLIGKNRFVADNVEIAFLTDAAGKTTAMIFSLNGQDTVARKIK